MEKEFMFNMIIKGKLDEAIEKIITETHEYAGTKSGDITPQQQMKLDDDTMAIANTIADQVYQNIET